MNYELRKFAWNMFGDIEVLMIGARAYFPAVQCAKMLGFKNPRKAVSSICDNTMAFEGREYVHVVGLQTLVEQAGNPDMAELFKTWIHEVVFPTITEENEELYDAEAVDELMEQPNDDEVVDPEIADILYFASSLSEKTQIMLLRDTLKQNKALRSENERLLAERESW